MINIVAQNALLCLHKHSKLENCMYGGNCECSLFVLSGITLEKSASFATMVLLASDLHSVTLGVEGGSDGEYDTGGKADGNIDVECSNLVGDGHGD